MRKSSVVFVDTKGFHFDRKLLVRMLKISLSTADGRIKAANKLKKFGYLKKAKEYLLRPVQHEFSTVNRETRLNAKSAKILKELEINDPRHLELMDKYYPDVHAIKES